MKSIHFCIIILVLVACQPVSMAITPTIAPITKTITPPIASALATSMPPTAIFPPNYPTPLNTPHISPTMIGQSSFDESLDFDNTRIDAFEGALDFTVQIKEVSLVTWTESLTLFQVIAAGTLRNVSNQPIVLRRTLVTGFDYHQDVSWQLSYAGGLLPYAICCVDYGVASVRSQQDYVLLQPGDTQNYSWIFVLPTSIEDTTGKPVSLSGKTINFTASYSDFRPGYDNMLDLSDPQYHFIDMNAWVGTVESNSTSFVFP